MMRPPQRERAALSLTIAIQMDPIETFNVDADSTFVLALRRRRAAMCCTIIWSRQSVPPKRRPGMVRRRSSRSRRLGYCGGSERG
jgi:hypothetical protein